jgi:hypothetical protein
MFMAYYMQLAVSLKLCWTLITQIPGVRGWLETHRTELSARALTIAFGIEETSGHIKSEADSLDMRRCFQIFFMLMVLYSV